MVKVIDIKVLRLTKSSNIYLIIKKDKLNIKHTQMINWTKELIKKELNTLRQACKENGEEFSDDMAFDIADSFLYDKPGLEEAIEKHMGVIDVQGYVANYIC